MKIKPLLITVLKMSSKKSEKEMIAIIIPKITEIIPQGGRLSENFHFICPGLKNLPPLNLIQQKPTSHVGFRVSLLCSGFCLFLTL